MRGQNGPKSATQQEKSLIEASHKELARDLRARFRRSHNRDFAKLIEREIGRRVRCTLGDFNPEENIVALVFPLEPEDPDPEGGG